MGGFAKLVDINQKDIDLLHSWDQTQELSESVIENSFDGSKIDDESQVDEKIVDLMHEKTTESEENDDQIEAHPLKLELNLDSSLGDFVRTIEDSKSPDVQSQLTRDSRMVFSPPLSGVYVPIASPELVSHLKYNAESFTPGISNRISVEKYREMVTQPSKPIFYGMHSFSVKNHVN